MEHQEASDSYEKIVNSLDIEDIKSQLNETSKKQKTLEDDINKIDNEISSLHRFSSIQAEMELLQSSLKTKENDIEKIKSKHGKALKKLFQVEEVPMKKLRGDLEEIQRKLVIFMSIRFCAMELKISLY